MDLPKAILYLLIVLLGFLFAFLLMFCKIC